MNPPRGWRIAPGVADWQPTETQHTDGDAPFNQVAPRTFPNHERDVLGGTIQCRGDNTRGFSALWGPRSTVDGEIFVSEGASGLAIARDKPCAESPDEPPGFSEVIFHIRTPFKASLHNPLAGTVPLPCAKVAWCPHNGSATTCRHCCLGLHGCLRISFAFGIVPRRHHGKRLSSRLPLDEVTGHTIKIVVTWSREY